MTAAMDTTFDKTATETIDLLEARLRRIEYALSGQTGEATAPITPSTGADASRARADEPGEPVSKRLADLEQTLHQITSRSRVIQDLLTLHARYPDLFQSIPASTPPATLDPSNLLSIILASGSSYSTTSSRLQAIRDAPIPAADLSAQLIELVPRVARLEAVQAAQEAEMAELRARSARAVRAWYESGVLEGGEGWAGLEGRVRSAEVVARRKARERAREAEEMG